MTDHDYADLRFTKSRASGNRKKLAAWDVGWQRKCQIFSRRGSAWGSGGGGDRLRARPCFIGSFSRHPSVRMGVRIILAARFGARRPECVASGADQGVQPSRNEEPRYRASGRGSDPHGPPVDRLTRPTQSERVTESPHAMRDLGCCDGAARTGG